MSEKPEQPAALPPAKHRRNIGKVLKLGGMIVLLAVLFALVINALVAVCNDGYYLSIGSTRYFNVNTDAMSPAIPSGSLISCVAPHDERRIAAGENGQKNGTVITFRAPDADGGTRYVTRRVAEIHTDENGVTRYVTRGDRSAETDAYAPKFNDIVGIYTGERAAGLGALFGFLQSGAGLVTLISVELAVIAAWIAVRYVRARNRREALERAAIKKGAEALSGVSLRYDNIHEITAVLDVLGMLSEKTTKEENADIQARLRAFIKADNIELPQTPETAAIFDSLPAPDNPVSLAAALAAGATLRQAEDGQTLVLTTISGGKTIYLTPVQTADGVILCQQGVRIRSDIAPNIENIGISSMPLNPEFFEGQPLEKTVVYPELPQPAHSFGPERLSPHAAVNSPVPEIMRELLSTPFPVASAPASVAKLPEHAARSSSPARPAEQSFIDPAPTEKTDKTDNTEKAEKADNAQPPAPTEKAEKPEKTEKPASAAKKRAPKTEEQKQAQRAAAAEKKRKQQEFLDSLTQDERERYLAAQKLAKEQAAAMRKLKREAARRAQDKTEGTDGPHDKK